MFFSERNEEAKSYPNLARCEYHSNSTIRKASLGPSHFILFRATSSGPRYLSYFFYSQRFSSSNIMHKFKGAAYPQSTYTYIKSATVYDPSSELGLPQPPIPQADVPPPPGTKG